MHKLGGLTHMALLLTILLLASFLPMAVSPATDAKAQGPILVEDWRYPLETIDTDMLFGSSPGIVDLGPDVNNKGTDPDAALEIVSGSDEFQAFYPDLGITGRGAWRCYDSQGNVEWARPTGSDEARSSVAIADITSQVIQGTTNGLDIAAGTTSGWNVEVMDRFGNFLWTYPWPPLVDGNFMWHSSPAVADAIPGNNGLEVMIGSRFSSHTPWDGGALWCFDGDNSDQTDDGITYTETANWYPGSTGTEGTDWDVLWTFDTLGSVFSTPAIGDVDNDGALEVVFGAGSEHEYWWSGTDGYVYCLDAASGAMGWQFLTQSGGVTGSAGLADFDGDGDLEVIVGGNDGYVYFIDGDENGNGSIDPNEVFSFDTGAPVHSSPAIGDVDGNGDYEIIIGSDSGSLYSFNYDPATGPTLNWETPVGDQVRSSPALANRTTVSTYNREWPFFRANAERTGLYSGPSSAPLDIYVTTVVDPYAYPAAGELVLVQGSDGSILDEFQCPGPIYTSPSVADVDGDNKLEIFFYDLGQYYGSANNDTFWCIEDTGGAEVPEETWVWKPGAWADYAPSGVPDFDQHQSQWSNFCGPVAAANSLWWFDSKFEPNPVPPPAINDNYLLVLSAQPGQFDDHDPSNVMPLVEELASLMNTNGMSDQAAALGPGTSALDLAGGIAAYLQARQLDSLYTITVQSQPSFEWVASEVEACEDVILLLGFWQDQRAPGAAEPEWVRLGGHYVTVPGISLQAGKIAFSDPAVDNAEGGSPGVVPVEHYPHFGYPLVHNDAQYVSHDIYSVKPTSSPGGTWGPYQYELYLGQNLWNFFGSNIPDETLAQYMGSFSQQGIIVSEVEYAIAVSPAEASPQGQINGLVVLQGRSNHSGATVAASPGSSSDTTGTNGSFAISPLPDDTYTVTASMPGYLSAEIAGVVISGGNTITLNTVILLGGNADGDGDIDISDVAAIAAAFNTSPPGGTGADINGDGLVDIFDLVLAGINFGKTESPWP